MKNFKHLLTVVLMMITLTFSVTSVYAQLNYDPFQRYGKTLPWSGNGNANGANPNDSDDYMVITVPPQLHLQWYGYRAHDFARLFGASISTLGNPVHAISDGIVEITDTDGWNGGLGRYIVINHGNGYKSRYSHLLFLALNQSDVGKTIRKGQEIGVIGETGNATGANLEFTLFHNGVPVEGVNDGIPYDGSLAKKELWWQWRGFETPVNTFNVQQYSKFSTETEVRPSDPDNQWDPAVIDPLDRYLENYGYLFPSGMIAEPINTALGSFIHRNVDIEINNAEGPALKFERFYNSPDKSIGFTGEGWSNTFNLKIIAHEENKYSVKLADGRGETFQETDEDPNTYTATFNNITPESFGTLKRLGEDQSYKFEYTDVNKTKYIFNSDRDFSNPNEKSVPSANWGKIETITDIDGRYLAFEYDVSGNLSKVSDSYNNTLSFTFGNDNLLDSVTSSDGRDVNYSYNFDGRLEKVTKTNEGEWVYGYDAGGRINFFKDAEGKLVIASNVYDDSGRVIEQKDGNGGITRFEYLAENNGVRSTRISDAKGLITEHTHDSNDYIVKEKFANGVEIKKEYDAKGKVTKQIDGKGNEIRYERDSNGNVIKETKSDGYVKTAEYNSLNLPTKITDPSGTMLMEYNSVGKLTKLTDQLGNSTVYEYNASNLLTKQTDPNGNVKQYTYTSNNLLASEKDLGTGSILSYEYDAAGNRTKVTDALGRETKIVYNSLQKATKIIDPKGNVTSFEYDKNGNLAKEIDPSGATKEYASDQNENITKITYANGSTEEFKFDGNNNKIEAKDRNGNITQYEYDTKNRLIAEIKADGSRVAYEYDANDNKIRQVDAKGNQTIYEYNSLNRLTKIVNANGDSYEFVYDILGRLIETNNYSGAVSRYEYDSLGRKIKEVDSQNNTTVFEYDSLDNLIRKIDARGFETTYFYDSANRLVAMQNPRGFQSTYQYNRVGNLISQTNFAGETTNFEYDANGNVIQSSNEAGHVTAFEYDSRDNLSKVIDPNGNATTFAYDAMNFKVREINALGAAREMQFDANGNLIVFKGENSNQVKNQYDALNRLVAEIDQKGNQSKYEYDANSNVTKLVDKNGNETKFEYDNLNRLTKQTNAQGGEKKFEYDKNSNTTKITDEAGSPTIITYDSLDRAIQVQNALGDSKTLDYDSLGRVTAQSDFKGNKDTYNYDEVGNVIKVTDRLGNETTITYDAGNRTTGINKPLSVTESKEYDNVGRLVKEINPENGTQTYTYDSAGNIVAITDAKGVSTSFEYDALNRNVKTIDGNGADEITNYDAIGRIVSQIDQNGNTTRFEYDSTNNITKIINAKGNASVFEYDSQGNVTNIINARGFRTAFEYDSLNRQIKTNLADGSSVSKKYDSVGRLIEITDPKGGISKTNYNAIGNILAEFDTANFGTSYSYDANSNVIEFKDKDGAQTKFEYDNLDRLTKQINPLGKSSEYSYDALGRTTQIKNERGAITTNEFDKLGRITKTTNALDNATSFSYDANGNLVKTTDALGRETAYSYDDVNRLINSVNAKNGQKSFSYDGVGNIVSVTDENGNTTSFGYDAVYNKVTQVNALGHSTNFAYDPNNNLARVTDANGNAINFEYDSRDRQTAKILAGGEVFKFEYDANGNISRQITTKGTEYNFSYDSRNLLTSKVDPLGNTESYEYDSMARLTKQVNPEGAATSFNYDALSRLTKVTDAINAQTSYEYDEIGNLLKEINANSKSTTYEYDLLDRRTKEINALGNSWMYTYDAVDNLVSKQDPNGVTIYKTYDELNRTTGITTSDQSETIAYEYDNVGNILKFVNGSTTNEYVYDAVYQVTTARQSVIDTESKTSTYGYDPVGNRTRVAYPDGRTAQYTYNANNLLSTLAVTYTGDVVAQDQPHTLTTTFEYDSNLKFVKQSNPNLTETVRSYDNADRLLQVSNYKLANTDEDSSTLEQKNIVSYTYELNRNGDRIKETILGTIDGYKGCENIDNNGGNGHNPGDCENPSSEKKTYEEILSVVRNYEYDPLRRLTNVNHQQTSETVRNSGNGNGNNQSETIAFNEMFSYDNVGNRTKYQVANAVNPQASRLVNYSYNDINQLVNDSEYTYSYDSNGNQLSKVSVNNPYYTNFEYNVFNQLTSVETKSSEGAIYAGNSSNVKDYVVFKFDYQYDALGRRVSKINNTDYSICKGNGEHQDDNNHEDCNNGGGNDTSANSAQGNNSKQQYPKNYVPYFGIDRVDYVYDSLTWETVSEYFTRVGASEKPGNNPQEPGNPDKPTEPGSPTDPTPTPGPCNAGNGNGNGNGCNNNGNGGTNNGNGGANNGNNGNGNANGNNGNQNGNKKNVRMQALTANDNSNGKKSDSADYFNVHTNYYKVGGIIIASDNIADRPIIEFEVCKGNGEHGDDSNPTDCNNGGGNDNKDKQSNKKNLFASPESNQHLSYYHYDGLGSVAARTGYDFEYPFTNSIIDPTVVQTPQVYQLNRYEAYGELKPETYSAKGNPHKSYSEPTLPGPFGFDDWNNKTYSTKELDVENENYYYGSRFYDASNGKWNRQDEYRGTIQDPMSLHRYMFVNDNPVNLVDAYGFQAIDTNGMSGNSHIEFLTGLKVNVDYYRNNSDLQHKTDAYYSYLKYGQSNLGTHFSNYDNYQGERNALNAQLPYLHGDMIQKKWQAYHAKIAYHENIGMNGVIGRLEARGYNLNYDTVYKYLSGKIIQTGNIYNIKQGQYQRASNAYYGTVGRVNTLSNFINQVDTFETNLSKISKDVHDTQLGIIEEAILQNEVEIIIQQERVDQAWANYQDSRDLIKSLFLNLAEGASCMTPGVETVCDGYGFLTGKDFNGNELEWWERIVSGIAFVVPAIGGSAVNKLNDVDNVSDTTKRADDVYASTPIGGKGDKFMTVPSGTNKATTINSRNFSGHALDRMQEQGIMPSVVENVIENGQYLGGKVPNTSAYYDNVNNITVITNSTNGNVITVHFGLIKQ